MTLLKRMHCVVKCGVTVAFAHLCFAPVFAQTPLPTEARLSGPGSVAGIWILSGYKGSKGTGPDAERDRVQHSIDGQWPPLLPWATALLEKRIRMSQEGAPFANTLTQCLPGGVPLMMFGAPYPVQILETAGQVTMLFEEQNHFRLIHLNATHPEDPDPTFMGHSIGHWQGDTLVVDTVGLTERTTIDQIGMPHSEDLRVIERYRRIDKNTLQIVVTIDDPKTFTKPWDAKAIYKSAPAGTVVNEYICENNRNAPNEQGQTGFSHPSRNKGVVH